MSRSKISNTFGEFVPHPDSMFDFEGTIEFRQEDFPAEILRAIQVINSPGILESASDEQIKLLIDAPAAEHRKRASYRRSSKYLNPKPPKPPKSPKKKK